MKTDTKIERIVINTERVKVFAQDYNGKTSYSLGVSSKRYVDGQRTDDWVNGYLPIQFTQGAPSNGQTISIDKSFLSAYEGKDGKAGIKLVVQEWSGVESEDSFGR